MYLSKKRSLSNLSIVAHYTCLSDFSIFLHSSICVASKTTSEQLSRVNDFSTLPMLPAVRGGSSGAATPSPCEVGSPSGWAGFITDASWSTRVCFKPVIRADSQLSIGPSHRVGWKGITWQNKVDKINTLSFHLTIINKAISKSNNDFHRIKRRITQ